VKLLTALPDPPFFGFIAALTRLLWSVAAAAVDLEATPDCWTRFEETNEEFEDVNRGCYADKCIDHRIASSVAHHGLSLSSDQMRDDASFMSVGE
jgi:hypothetical protein